MEVAELKKKIAALSPESQEELAAYLHRLRMDRRFLDRNPESWVRLEDLEQEIGNETGE